MHATHLLVFKQKQTSESSEVFQILLMAMYNGIKNSNLANLLENIEFFTYTLEKRKAVPVLPLKS